MVTLLFCILSTFAQAGESYQSQLIGQQVGIIKRHIEKNKGVVQSEEARLEDCEWKRKSIIIECGNTGISNLKTYNQRKADEVKKCGPDIDCTQTRLQEMALYKEKQIKEIVICSNKTIRTLLQCKNQVDLDVAQARMIIEQIKGIEREPTIQVDPSRFRSYTAGDH